MRTLALVLGGAALACGSTMGWSAFADDSAAKPSAPTAGPDAAQQPPKPPPYSLPWQLRTVVPATVLRSDTSLAFRTVPKGKERSIASMLLFSYKLHDSFSPFVRVALAADSNPGGTAGASFVNPVIGALAGWKVGNFRIAPALMFALPVGMGGGDDPAKEVNAATRSGVLTRSAMDNAMFAANYFTPFGGLGIAYVASGFTVQVEATILELIRVKGEKVDKDETRTNFTTGLHVGYFLDPMLSLGGELRAQVWLSTPAFVEADKTNSLRETATMALGPRLHFKLGDKSWIRPGVAYARGLDDPGNAQDFWSVQLDVPIVF